MYVCNYCNTENSEGNEFCSNCGQKINNVSKNEKSVKWQTKLWAVFSYLNIGGLPMFLIPFIAKRKNDFVHFHSIQGGLIYAILIVESIPATILRNIFPSVSYVPKVVTEDAFSFSYSTIVEPIYSTEGLIIHWIFLILEIIILITQLIGIINALMGKKKILIGKNIK